MTVPPVLLDYQARWISDPSPVALIQKSRRVGITWSSAADAVLTAAQAGGMNCYYSGLNREMAQDFVADAADFVRAFGIAASAIEEIMFPDGDDGKKSILSYKINFASNRQIIALSSRPSAIRGKQGVYYIDEAAFHPDLPGMIKASIALLMWGGRIRIISTHFGIENPFNQLIEEAKVGQNPYSIHRITIDDAIRSGLYKRMCLVSNQIWTPDKEAQWRQELFDYYGDYALEELMCEPSADNRAYIPRVAVEQCMIDGPPVIRLSLDDSFLHKPEAEREAIVERWIAEELSADLAALPRNLKTYVGEDFGRSGDLTSLVVFTEHEDLSYETAFIVELRNTPFEAQRQIVFAVLDRLPHFMRAAFDATANGGFLGEVVSQRYYGKAEALKMSDEFYRNHMPKLRDALENKRLRIPRHADIMRDLQQIEIIRGVPKVDPNRRQKGTDGKPRHADSAMALCLAVYAANQSGEPPASAIEHTPDGRNPYASQRRRSSIWPTTRRM